MLIYALFSQCEQSLLSAGFGRKKLIQTSLPGLISCLFTQNVTENARDEKTKGWVWLQITLCPPKKAAKFKFVFITTFCSPFFQKKNQEMEKKLSEQFPKIFQPLHTNLDLKKGKLFCKKLQYHNANIAINRKNRITRIIFFWKFKNLFK